MNTKTVHGYIQNVFTGTHKFFHNWELSEEFDTAKVVARGNGSPRVVEMSRVHVCLVSIFGPNSNDIIPQNTTYACV